MKTTECRFYHFLHNFFTLENKIKVAFFFL